MEEQFSQLQHLVQFHQIQSISTYVTALYISPNLLCEICTRMKYVNKKTMNKKHLKQCLKHPILKHANFDCRILHSKNQFSQNFCNISARAKKICQKIKNSIYHFHISFRDKNRL